MGGDSWGGDGELAGVKLWVSGDEEKGSGALYNWADERMNQMVRKLR